MAQLLYQGHASFRLTLNSGAVIYIDPFAGEDYDRPADLVLITHEHHDHNNLELITCKTGARVIRAADCLNIVEGQGPAGHHPVMIMHKRLRFGEEEGADNSNPLLAGLTISATEASNANHNSRECVGFLVEVDGVTCYFAGDTSKVPGMNQLAKHPIDYAFYPCDGIYNMDLEEAAACAALVGAKHNTPIHMIAAQKGIFNAARAEAWAAPNKLILTPGTEVALVH